MSNVYPVPSFHFTVQWGEGLRVGFTEVTGLTQESQVIEYRGGDYQEYSTIKMPGLRKFSNIVCKRGIFKADFDFTKWLNTIKMNEVQRRNIIISLLDSEHQPVMTWQVTNAFMAKLEGPQLKASANEVAIESMELAHEGIQVLLS